MRTGRLYAKCVRGCCLPLVSDDGQADADIVIGFDGAVLVDVGGKACGIGKGDRTEISVPNQCTVVGVVDAVSVQIARNHRDGGIQNVSVSVGESHRPSRTDIVGGIGRDCVAIGNLRTVIWRAWDVCMKI